jgi:2-polyprenyl-3-methyl-5-hydroxy-6-metoxy-1,4-benzoquinol methylase
LACGEPLNNPRLPTLSWWPAGDGFLSRRLKQAGAASVLGLDISSKMVELAEAEEKKNPLGVKYLVKYLCMDATKVSSKSGSES